MKKTFFVVVLLPFFLHIGSAVEVFGSNSRHYGSIPDAVSEVRNESAEELDVMSFNIRYGLAKDGDNDWDKRKADLAAFVNYEYPDVVGMQEVLDFQRAYLESVCTEYEFAGAGRDDGKKGEQTMIMWKKARFEMMDWGYFWLSKKPEVPSRGWDAMFPRTATWVLLKDKESGQAFYFVNTHLDHKGAKAQKKGLNMIRSRMASINKDDLPIVLTGDFNIRDDNPIIRRFNSRMNNSRETAVRTDNLKSYNAWGKEARSSAIDYIYYKYFSGCDLFQTMTEGFNGRLYLSDHYPVRARLKF